MKKYLLFFLSLMIGVVTFTSCGDDEDGPKISDLEKKYFKIENANYIDKSFPTKTTDDKIEGLSVNPKALAGGMNFITITSLKKYKKFFVGVKGVNGYWESSNNSSRTSTSDYSTYIIPLLYSTELNSNMTMLISAEDEDDEITDVYETSITYVDSESGDLNINLTFSNAKDVDLHLYTPTDEHIYYGHRGGSTTVDGKEVSYGLDHDSNAGCSIDNLNNENIYLPAELIVNGTYKVVVNMYENCNRSIPTSWAIVTRYKGNIITPASGSNPASGVYAVNAGNGDHTTVMTFTINDGVSRAAAYNFLNRNNFTAIPTNDMDEMKSELEGFKLDWTK